MLKDKNIRKCYRCKILKPLKEYYKNKSDHLGYTRVCKTCNTEFSKEKRYKKDYGITIKDYDEMAALQHGECFICGQFTSLVVDHNHGTGKIRKLLCNRCNYNLGVYKEDTKIFQNFIDYIKFQP